jgi:hypothetical protein
MIGRDWWDAADDEPAPPALEADGLAKVVGWHTQKFVAEAFGRTTRWIQELERRGFPVDGPKGEPRYPMPHIVVWYEYYLVLQANGEPPKYIDLHDAFRFRAEQSARELREIEERCARDLIFALSIAAADAGVDDRPLVREITSLVTDRIRELRESREERPPREKARRR